MQGQPSLYRKALGRVGLTLAHIVHSWASSGLNYTFFLPHTWSATKNYSTHLVCDTTSFRTHVVRTKFCKRHRSCRGQTILIHWPHNHTDSVSKTKRSPSLLPTSVKVEERAWGLASLSSPPPPICPSQGAIQLSPCCFRFVTRQDQANFDCPVMSTAI